MIQHLTYLSNLLNEQQAELDRIKGSGDDEAIASMVRQIGHTKAEMEGILNAHQP